MNAMNEGHYECKNFENVCRAANVLSGSKWAQARCSWGKIEFGQMKRDGGMERERERTRIGPNRPAADMREMENRIF